MHMKGAKVIPWQESSGKGNRSIVIYLFWEELSEPKGNLVKMNINKKGGRMCLVQEVRKLGPQIET